MIRFSHCLVQRCQQEGYLKEQASNEVVQVVQSLWCQIRHALSCNQALLISMRVDVMQYWRATFQSKNKKSDILHLTRRSLSCNYLCTSKNTLNTLTTPRALVAMPAWPEALIYNFAELWQNPEHPIGCTSWLKKNGDWRFYCAIFS